MKKRLRLTRQRDFQRVLGGPRLYSGRGLVAFAQPGPASGPRVGVAVSRQVRGAVRRNRARRRLREAVRAQLGPALAQASAGLPGDGRGIGLDVVLIARPAALSLAFADLQAEASAALHEVGVA